MYHGPLPPLYSIYNGHEQAVIHHQPASVSVAKALGHLETSHQTKSLNQIYTNTIPNEMGKI